MDDCKILKKPARAVNLDLLRIIAMLLIIFLHSIDHSGVLENVAPGSFTYYYVYYGYSLSQVCVNVYVLISGYFLVSSAFKIKKLIFLWAETVFYSLVLRIIFIATGVKSFSVASIVSCLVPVTTGRYWFITIYFAMYLVSPFLGAAIRKLSKNQLGLLNMVLFVLFSVWSSVHPSIAGVNSGGGWGLAWFVVLYLTAAWIRLYYVPTYRIAVKTAAFFLLPLAVSLLLLFANLSGIGIIKSIVLNLYKYDSVSSYIASVLLMLIFINLRVPDGKFAKFIIHVSPLTFGVYLIHAHADVSPWLWDFLDLPSKMGSIFFPFIQVAAVLAVFIACCLIDFVRKPIAKCLCCTKPVELVLDKAEKCKTALVKAFSK